MENVVMKTMRFAAAFIVMSGLAMALYGAEGTTKSGSATPPATMPWQALPSKRTDEGAMKTHEAFLARAKEGPIGVLFIGDSITAGWKGKAI
jgi:hypothetical protein